MTLPTITTIQVATVPLAAFLAREAAILAAAGSSSPLPEIDFTRATVILGDGNTGSGATVPPISTLQSTGAVTHQVWSGSIVQAVTVDASNANAVDVLCVVPAVDTSGAEIGPFYVTEFIITDELGAAMIAGTTLMPKLVTANGTAVDLAFIAEVGFSLGTVVLTPPSAAFVSMAQVLAAFNAHLTSATAPITTSDTIDAQGWKNRVFGLPLSGAIVNPGWIKLPNGLIVQWGGYSGTTGTVTSGGGVYEAWTTVTWPVSFPNAVFGAIAGAYDVWGGGLQEQAWFANGAPPSSPLQLTQGQAALACRQLGVTMSGWFLAFGN